MGFRFRKSFKLGPTRINLSRSGIGTSIGVKGLRVGAGPRGAYASAGIPGTGISVRKGLGSSRTSQGTSQADPEATRMVLSGCGIGCLGLLELLMLIALPPFGAALILATAIAFAYHRHKRANDPQWQFNVQAKLAVRHAQNAEWEKALQALDECERFLPNKPETQGLRGQVLFQLKRWADAVTALQAGSLNETERLMLAECLRHLKKFAESNDVLKTPPVDEQLFLQSLLIRGANHVELKEPEVAIDVLKRAPLRKRNLDEPLKQIHYILAKAYEESGKPTDAIRHLRRIYAVDAGFMDVESDLRRLQAERISAVPPERDDDEGNGNNGDDDLSEGE